MAHGEAGLDDLDDIGELVERREDERGGADDRCCGTDPVPRLGPRLPVAWLERCGSAPTRSW